MPSRGQRILGAFVYLSFLGFPYPLVPIWVFRRRDRVFTAHLRAAFGLYLATSVGVGVLASIGFIALGSDLIGLGLTVLVLLAYTGMCMVLAVRAATGWVPFTERPSA